MSLSGYAVGAIDPRDFLKNIQIERNSVVLDNDKGCLKFTGENSQIFSIFGNMYSMLLINTFSILLRYPVPLTQ